MKNKKGFTLIELVVVMAVITIISAMAYPKISGYLMVNRENYRSSQEYVVNKALIQYYALTGNYYAPYTEYYSGDPISETDVITMINELNNKTGAMISNDSSEYIYIKEEGCDISGQVDIRKIRVEIP